MLREHLFIQQAAAPIYNVLRMGFKRNMSRLKTKPTGREDREQSMVDRFNWVH